MIRGIFSENRLWLATSLLASVLTWLHLRQLTADPALDKVIDSTAIIAVKNGSGSGFFITDDGCLMTARHVVLDAIAKKYQVFVFLRGSPFVHKATVVSASEYLDIAIICSDTARRPALTIAATEYLKEGQTVYAIGHPTGGSNWHVTNGVISRFAYRMTEFRKTWLPRYEMITSAFISWGNSGGPVVDRNGNVVGIIVKWADAGVGHPSNMNVAVTGSDMIRFRRTVWGK